MRSSASSSAAVRGSRSTARPVDAPERTLVFVPPQVNRTAFAEEPGTTVPAIGSTVGKPYEVSGWEVWAEFHPAYEAGTTTR